MQRPPEYPSGLLIRRLARCRGEVSPERPSGRGDSVRAVWRPRWAALTLCPLPPYMSTEDQPLEGLGMATDHVANLEKAHDQLVAQRRSLAEALAAGYQRGETEKANGAFRSIQGTLADILDERRRAPQRT
jgi:hypothetical protein